MAAETKTLESTTARITPRRTPHRVELFDRQPGSLAFVEPAALLDAPQRPVEQVRAQRLGHERVITATGITLACSPRWR